jgi:hypothetical protein
MKLAVFAALAAFAVSDTNAGTLKFPVKSTTTLNAGMSLPVRFEAKGLKPDSTVNISLVNAKTWVSTVFLMQIPIVNGINTIDVPVSWSWWEVGTYAVRLDGSSGEVCTSSNNNGPLVRIRSAVIWPYGGTRFYRNYPADVKWTTPTGYEQIIADYFEITLSNELGGESYLIDAEADPDAGSLRFTVPDVAGGRYRIFIDGYLIIPGLPDDPDFPWPDLSEVTRSEAIIID